MKLIIRLSLMLVLITGMMTSCKKAVPKQAKHIPKTALFVTTINTKSIQSKLLQSQATIENILKSATGSDTSASKGKQEWEDLQNSGLDLSDNFYISIVQKNAGMSARSGTMVMSALGTLKDEKKLQAYIKKKQPQAEVRKEKNYSYTSANGDNMIAWKDDLVIAMSYQKSFDGQMELDSTTGTYNLKEPANAEVNMKAEMDAYFNMKEEESVAAIPEFRDLMSNKSDASMWINSSNSLEAIPLPRVKELLGSSYTAATLNFEDGKVAVDSKSYYSKELRDILKKHSGASADLNMVEKFPSNNINGFFVFAINPEFINAIVRQLELGGMVDAWLTKNMGKNYTLTDLLKAIKGDFAMVVSDAQFAQVSNPSNQQMPTPPKFNMLGNIAVGDKVQMNKLMDKMVEMQLMEKSAAGYTLSPKLRQQGFIATVDDKNILISMNEATINDYKAGNKKAQLDKDVMDKFKDKQGVAYVNISSILNGITVTDTAANNVMGKAKETFKDIRASVEKFDGKTVEAHYQLTFINEKENSLASLLKFAEATSKNINKSRMNKVNVDSIPVSMR